MIKYKKYLKDNELRQYKLSKDKWYEYIAFYYFEKMMRNDENN